MSNARSTSFSTPCDALIVSPDPLLAGEAARILAAAGCATVVAARLAEAEAAVAASTPAVVVIDLRGPMLESPTGLLHGLAPRRKHRTRVVLVTDTGYGREWAVLAEQVATDHLRLAADEAAPGRALADALAGNPAAFDPGTLAPRILRGRSVSFKTYTAEMFHLLDELVTVAAHDVTVLLIGETGTGKSTLARLIHELSPRHPGRLVTVACGALPPELIESELFGHVKGAFTGADQTKAGKFDAAADGTLLLDEIDVLRPAQQAKLLRVIETGEYEPVGSNDTRTSPARLVVASNVDLKRLMEENQFRADLYYRLNMLELRLLPLRERPRDIVPLALDFIEEFREAHRVKIERVDPDFLACLRNYGWPGNVRELKNHVRRAVLFCRSGILTPDELSPRFRETADESPAARPLAVEPEMVREVTFAEKVAATERELVEEALREHGQNRTATARALGISRVGLYKKMKKFGMITAREDAIA